MHSPLYKGSLALTRMKQKEGIRTWEFRVTDCYNSNGIGNTDACKLTALCREIRDRIQ